MKSIPTIKALTLCALLLPCAAHIPAKAQTPPQSAHNRFNSPSKAKKTPPPVMTWQFANSAGWLCNVQNEDHHRTMAVIVRLPNPSQPGYPVMKRFVIEPCTFVSVGYFRMSHEASIVSWKYDDQ